MFSTNQVVHNLPHSPIIRSPPRFDFATASNPWAVCRPDQLPISRPQPVVTAAPLPVRLADNARFDAAWPLRASLALAVHKTGPSALWSQSSQESEHETGNWKLTLYSFSNHYNYRTKRAYLQANRRCDTGSMRGSDAINHPSSDHESNLSVSSPFFPN